jgi:hypothetical protein
VRHRKKRTEIKADLHEPRSSWTAGRKPEHNRGGRRLPRGEQRWTGWR